MFNIKTTDYESEKREKVTGDLFGTPSRTQLTLNIEQVLLFVEFLFSIIMEDITKQKKNIYWGKDVLLEKVKMHVKEVVTLKNSAVTIPCFPHARSSSRTIYGKR